jgi:hypothetical protein
MMTLQVDQPPLEQTGPDILDPVARRRLQNRLNQRASSTSHSTCEPPHAWTV